MTHRNFAFYSCAAFLVAAMLCATGIRTDTGNAFMGLTMLFSALGLIGFIGFLVAPKRRQEANSTD